MKRKASLLTILMFASSISGARSTSENSVDRQVLNAAFAKLPTYTYGQGEQDVATIDKAVVTAQTDARLRSYLEKHLVAVVSGDSTIMAKGYACCKLALVGSEQAVPALARLLHDRQAAHMALFALERIPSKAVDRVLREALDDTTGLVKVGVINSIGNRRDSLAVEGLIKSLQDDGLEIKKAAVIALGKIGTIEAARALEEYARNTPDELRRCVQDGRLRAAENLLKAGQKDEALSIYQDIYQNGQEPHIRLAGFHGLLLTEPSKAERRLLSTLRSDDSYQRGFAARKVTEMPSGQDMTAYIQSLEHLPTVGQVALIGALALRGERAAAPTVRKFVGSSSPIVLDAALEALGKIGDASDVLLLAKVAAKGQDQESRIARQSLLELKGPEVNRQIVESLQYDDKQVRVELINSLAARMATSAAKDINEYLNDSNQMVRLAALKALGALGGRKEIVILTDFLNNLDNNKERAGALSALRSICGRLGKECADPILAGLKKASESDRIDLIGLLPIVGGDAALQAVQAATSNQDPDIQDAGIRALAQWPDQGAREDLQNLANQARQLNHRVLAFRGYIRLVKQADMPDAEKAKRLRDAVRKAERREEKVLALSGFGDIHSLESLKRMEQFIYNEDISEEVCAVVVKICSNLGAEYKADIAVALIQVLQIAKNDRTLEDARGLMHKLGIQPES